MCATQSLLAEHSLKPGSPVFPTTPRVRTCALIPVIVKKFFKCLFLFERERACVSRGGAEGEGDTEAGSRL